MLSPLATLLPGHTPAPMMMPFVAMPSWHGIPSKSRKHCKQARSGGRWGKRNSDRARAADRYVWP